MGSAASSAALTSTEAAAAAAAAGSAAGNETSNCGGRGAAPVSEKLDTRWFRQARREHAVCAAVYVDVGGRLQLPVGQAAAATDPEHLDLVLEYACGMRAERKFVSNSHRLSATRALKRTFHRVGNPA